jgi:site-specific DNA-methyltransferase (adenine-specific)/modification methylase
MQGKRTDLEGGDTPLQGLGYSRAHLRTFRQIFHIPPGLRDQYMDGQDETNEEISTRGLINWMRARNREERVEALDNDEGPSVPLDGMVILGKMEDQLSVVNDESVDLVLTDPPYGLGDNAQIEFAPVGRGKKQAPKREPLSRTAGEWDKFNAEADVHPQFRSWINLIVRTMKPAASLYIFVADKYIGQMWNALEHAGLTVRNLLVWQKLNPPPMVRKKHWGWASEHILFATLGDKYTFNWGAHHEMHNIVQCPICGGTERLDHPTQKPVRLLRRFVEVSSNPGGTVMDPFAGVGSTGQAARELGRQYVCIEADEKYYRRACRRLGEPVSRPIVF